MIGLDSSRNIIRDMKYIEKDLSKKEFLVIDNYNPYEYHFEPYQSDNLIYLAEKDLTYSIKDLKNGLIVRAPYRVGKDYIQSVIDPCIELKIPQLTKILKNRGITKTNASEKIKERDDCCCQLCGETDFRTLNVHHIVPRKSPFIPESFIHSPMNQITLCANCHSIEHYVLRNEDATERKEHIKRMLCINGFNWKDNLDDSYYAPIKDITRENKIEYL
ncbi:hypothetical protein BK798_06325 [Methanobrevibacter smithii]|uniref:HNH nuclease domain-containing protein n=1 Tax=Methanobrevibacter smithii TaxID=2173 RepID=A0A2H4U7H0_METSM|nr:HNH endonuclease [Methanobrevibacter smithii]ATZ60066.1 hypothetical protein BK798_06325 [Methanobrevibacter smithii]